MMIFKYTKFPNAAKEYLRFMMEREQYVPWQEASIGYVCHPLGGYEKSPFWTDDPKNTPYRDCMKNMTPNGYAGSLGYASAACVADFIIPNMVAEAASGSKTPKEAAAGRRSAPSATTRSELDALSPQCRASQPGSAPAMDPPTWPTQSHARFRAPSTTAPCSGCSSCCPRRRCCCSSSPIRWASAPGSASPTPRSAAAA